jgi:tetratricopeptide (TPR) repeat protein
MSDIEVVRGTHGHLGENRRKGRRGKLPGRKQQFGPGSASADAEALLGSLGVAGVGPASDAGPAAATRSNNAVEGDKRSLCVETLAAGFVQSYVDFFYLTHRPDPAAAAAAADGEVPEIEVPVDDMIFVKDALISAEGSRRRAGQIAAVYKSYDDLARHFQDRDDHKTGIYFYEKCLEIARMTVDTEGEMRANHSLGKAYEAVSEFSEAVKFHERHLELAELAGDDAAALTANEQLVRAYRGHAEAVEGEGDYEEACVLHQRCLDAAARSGSRRAEGRANFRLGRVKVLLGRSEEGMGHLEEHLGVCQELKDLEGQGEAYSALAAAHRAAESPDDAVSCLMQCLKIAEQTDDLRAQAEACCSLGVIFNQKKLFDRAVSFFQRNYELTRTLVSRGDADPRLVDKARINLGMARGNQTLGSYMYAISYENRSLLKWKNSRVEIMSSG